MRHKVVELIAILCYFLGVDLVFYYLNRRAKRIITFHNVMPKELLPEGKSIGLTDTEESFRLKVRIIKSRFKISTNVFDSGTATITFDDGYKNQSEIAGRILKEEGNIPAIVFATGRMLNNDKPCDALVVDLLLHWTWLAPNGRYDLSNSLGIRFELTDDNRSNVWESVIWPAFICDYDIKGRNLLLQLSNMYSIERILFKCDKDYLSLRMTGISNDDITRLTENGWLIGWHTSEHFPLSKLDAKEREAEISNAPKCFKSIVFSYPYGETKSVNAECLLMAERAGFPCAVSNVCEPNKLTGKFFIPRMMLSDKKYLAHLELSGVKYFFLNKKLLPVVKTTSTLQ